MNGFSTVVRPEPVNDLPSETSAALVEASNAFAVDLWARIGRQDGNLAISPASISLALAMTWAGARGETADQMAGVLHFEGREGIHEAAAALLHRWSDPERTVCELRVVNRLFGERSYPFVEKFLKLVRRRYGAPLECVDFRNAPEPSRERINTWIETQTAKRIRSLLSPGTVDSLTGLVLTNAVYFLGKWVDPFEGHRTRDATFRTPRQKTQLPTMHQTGYFLYSKTRHLKILEMPYQGRDFSMTLLLPRAVDGLEALEKQISSGMIGQWLARLQKEEVQVALPRFAIDPANSIGLESILGSMGMPRAFDQTAADFTGIAVPPDPRDRLFIDKVVHRSFVKVDEAGTEAAGATAVVMRVGAALRRPKPKRFRADHPFVFLIREVRSGMILFMGRVTDPRA